MTDIDSWRKPEDRASAMKQRREESIKPYLESMLSQLSEPDGRLLKSWSHELLSQGYFYRLAYPILQNARTQLQIAEIKYDANGYTCEYCGELSRAKEEKDVKHVSDSCAIGQIDKLLRDPFGDTDTP